jgi:CMP-2-keto-3-deoxyoctulosonic acid synthetase
MKKEIKKSKVTVDKLAIMTNNGFDILRKEMKNGFERLEERMATKTDLDAQQKTLKIHGDVLQIMLKEIKAIHEDSKSFRNNISTLYTDHVSYDRKIENLTVRVEKLEIKNS